MGGRGKLRRVPRREDGEEQSQSMMVDSLKNLFDSAEMQFDPMMYKTLQCTVPNCSEEMCHRYHSDKDRRRTVNEHHYDSKPCKWLFTGEAWKSASECKFRDECRFAHSIYEVRYHPKVYKTQHCDNSLCRLGIMCWNKHEPRSEQKPTVVATVSEDVSSITPLYELLTEKEEKSQRLFSELEEAIARLNTVESELEGATLRASCFHCRSHPIAKALIPCGHVLCGECVDRGRDKCPACNSIAMIKLELKLGQ